MLIRNIIISLFLFGSHAVYACSTCMVGDPTQTLMGTEKPYEDRLRFSIETMLRDETIGVSGVNKKVIDEFRTSFNVAWAPDRRMMLSINAPIVNRQLDSFNLANEEVTTLGDITLSFKSYLQEKVSFQKHMYGLTAGIRLPTAKEETLNGIPLDFDVQAGTGSTTVNVGAWYARYDFPFMFYTSTAYHTSNEGNQNFQAGDAIVLNASLQYAPDHDLSFPVGLEARWSETDTFSDIADPDSGGLIVYIAPGIIYTLHDDLLLSAAVKIPLIENLKGDHEEGTIITFGVTYDFDMHQ